MELVFHEAAQFCMQIHFTHGYVIVLILGIEVMSNLQINVECVLFSEV